MKVSETGLETEYLKRASKERVTSVVNRANEKIFLIRSIAYEKTESGIMLFVVKATWKPEKMPDFIKVATENMAKPLPEGTKGLGTYLLLGRCQMVSIIDAPDEKAIFKIHQPYMEIAECDWAPAITPEEATKALTE